jgi:hypothetical protein
MGLSELASAIEKLTLSPCEDDLDEGYRLLDLLESRLRAVEDEIEQRNRPRSAEAEAALQHALDQIDEQFRRRAAIRASTGS